MHKAAYLKDFKGINAYFKGFLGKHDETCY